MLRTNQQRLELRKLIIKHPDLIAEPKPGKVLIMLKSKGRATRYHETVMVADLYEAIDTDARASVPESLKPRLDELMSMQSVRVNKHSKALDILKNAFSQESDTWQRINALVGEPISLLEEAGLPEPTLHQIDVARMKTWPIRI